MQKWPTIKLGQKNTEKGIDMKKEAKFYQIIKNACKSVCAFCYKIADSFPGPDKRFVPKKPFDMFFVWEDIAAFIEVKYMPEIRAFSTQMQLSEHQNEALSLIYKNITPGNYNIKSFVVLGIYRPREIKRIYIFDYNWLKEHPLKKKDLLGIGKYIDIKKDTFDMNMFFMNIIGEEDSDRAI